MNINEVHRNFSDNGTKEPANSRFWNFYNFWTAWNFLMRFSLLCSGEWALSFYMCVFIYIGVSLIHSIILHSSHTFIGCILVGNNSFSVITDTIFTGLSGFVAKSIFALDKGQGGLVTSFSISDNLYIGNQQQMQKWFREIMHLVAVAGQNHYFKDGLLFEAVWCNTNIKSSSNYWWQMTFSNGNLFPKMQQ